MTPGSVSIILALSSALIYGMADYCGGRSSRVQPSVLVALVGQTFSLVIVFVALAIAGTSFPGGASLGWGGLGGAAGAIGLACFYDALARGEMTVVAPLTAVVGASLPIAVGLATGERPKAIAYGGIALAIVAVALVSGAIGTHERRTSARVMGLAVVAGIGFVTLFGRSTGPVTTPGCGHSWPHAPFRSHCSRCSCSPAAPGSRPAAARSASPWSPARSTWLRT